MAGRLTPLMRPIRSSAAAIVAPVLPAETIAEALPSRTASAARTSVESFLVRTAAPGSSSMAISSLALISSMSSSWTRSGGPTSTTGMPSSTARRTPARISRRAHGRRPWRRRRWAASSGDVRRRRRRRGSCTSRTTGTPCAGSSPPQRGHTLRAGASSFQAPARRLRDFDFDFFFLGTAIVGLRDEIRAAPGYRPDIPGTPTPDGVRARVGPGGLDTGTPMAADGSGWVRSWSRADQRSSTTALSHWHGPAARSAPHTGHSPGQSPAQRGRRRRRAGRAREPSGSRSIWPCSIGKASSCSAGARRSAHRRRRRASPRAGAGSVGRSPATARSIVPVRAMSSSVDTSSRSTTRRRRSRGSARIDVQRGDEHRTCGAAPARAATRQR